MTRDATPFVTVCGRSTERPWAIWITGATPTLAPCAPHRAGRVPRTAAPARGQASHPARAESRPGPRGAAWLELTVWGRVQAAARNLPLESSP